MPSNVQEALDFIRQHRKANVKAGSAKREKEEGKRRQDYLRDAFAWGLAANLKATRSEYAKGVAKEEMTPAERGWLIGEVARISKMKAWSERKEREQRNKESEVVPLSRGKSLTRKGMQDALQKVSRKVKPSRRGKASSET